jgi:hypothetical protein
MQKVEANASALWETGAALGKPDKALPLIEKSLALLSDQPAVKALEEQAKKRLGLR